MTSESRIGCSLPMRFFTDLAAGARSDAVSCALQDAFGGAEALLAFAARHAWSIELRTVNAGTAPEAVLAAARFCHAAGLRITVHGTAEASADPVRFFAPYRALFASGLQDCVCITVHALPGREETETYLSALLDTVSREALPVRLMLENNRRKSERRCGDSLEEVCSIVRALQSDRLSVCWDMGHYTSDLRTYGCCGSQTASGAVTLPPPEQLTSVGHTHIHAFCRGTTHFPLHMGELALPEAVSALRSAGYTGIYSLEPDFPRFLSLCSAREALEESFRLLEQALKQEAEAL